LLHVTFPIMAATKKEDDEIWNELFGDDGKNKHKKGHTSLTYKEDKEKSRKSRRDQKHRSRDRPSSRSSQSASHSSSQRSAHSKSASQSSHHAQSSTNGHSHYHHEGPSTAERLSQFLCTPKNRARLPPPPLRCKFLKYPHQKDRFTKWCATNLELNYEWQLHHDSLFPIPLDLMDPDYFNPLKEPIDFDDAVPNREKDRKILQMLEDREYARTAKEETSLPEQEAFLLQTTYIMGGHEYELTENQRKSYDREDRKRRKKRSRGQKRSRSSSDSDGGYYGRRNNPHSVENVAQSFVDVQNITKHPRRNVEVERTFDVFPHDECLEWEYTHVHYDNNPAVHIKKCNFMPKFQEDQLRMADESTEHGLLRCVNQRALEIERRRSSKMEHDDDEDDELAMSKVADKEADWFSLYSSDGKKRRSEYDLGESQDFEWTAEYVPVQMDRKQMRFLVVPRSLEGEVFYANLDDRLSLRHRATDSSHINEQMMGGKKGLSEQDKKFFRLTPMNIKLNVPLEHHEEE